MEQMIFDKTKQEMDVEESVKTSGKTWTLNITNLT